MTTATAANANTNTNTNSNALHPVQAPTTVNNSNPQHTASQEDISADGLLKVISQEWTNEMDRIKQLGLNGYKRRKDSRQDCLVQSGHAEIEGDKKLFIYGNALEVLNN